MTTFYLETLGCKVNIYESEGMREVLLSHGMTEVSDPADASLCLVNTCTVTHTADLKCQKALHHLRKAQPTAVIMAFGCYAEQKIMGHFALTPQEYVSLKTNGTAPLYCMEPGADADVWVSNASKKDVFALYQAYLEFCEKGFPKEDASAADLSAPDFEITAQDSHSRAFLKVQDGCRSFCTYCIISYVRGNLHSKPLDQCLREAASLAEAGYKEIVLTGIQLSAYGDDWTSDTRTTLADLIVALSQIPKLVRIRLGSLEPRVITDEFLQKVACSKLCHHFHLALQSGSDSVLKRMNRHYSTEEYADAVQKILNVFPDAAFTTDIMVAFPGETDREFEESLGFVQRIGFADMHVFRFSPRLGTKAYDMKPKVDKRIGKIRSEKMIQVARSLHRDFIISSEGQTKVVLLERQKEDGCWEGYTDNYLFTKVRGVPEGARSQSLVLVQTEGLSLSDVYQEACDEPQLASFVSFLN